MLITTSQSSRYLTVTLAPRASTLVLIRYRWSQVTVAPTSVPALPRQVAGRSSSQESSALWSQTVRRFPEQALDQKSASENRSCPYSIPRTEPRRWSSARSRTARGSSSTVV
ncbi:Uncharacterised protein [Mycobacteroides abscessus subsp. abscessus]|nr:Uncharacterised protein [Mycobacteroides abscessus subsp. abscessus]